ncbi:MAG: hypothetical protein AAGA37_02910 [Actinomycetota bacterium]
MTFSRLPDRGASTMEKALLVVGICLVCLASIRALGGTIGWGDDGGAGEATGALQRDSVDASTPEEVIQADRNVDDRSSSGLGYAAASITGTPDVDGSFEDGLTSSYTIYGAGSTIHSVGADVGGWEVVKGTVETNDAQRHDFGQNARSVDLNGNGPGAIQRQVPVVPGVMYTISMTVAENRYCGPSTKTMAVEWNGERIAELDVNLPRGDIRTYEIQLPASPTDTGTLYLEGLSSSSCGVVIDDASISLDPV